MGTITRLIFLTILNKEKDTEQSVSFCLRKRGVVIVKDAWAIFEKSSLNMKGEWGVSDNI